VSSDDANIMATPPRAHHCRKLEDFDLHKELYRGKSSLLYMATEKKSGMQVALKLYRKKKLSTLNRYQEYHLDDFLCYD
jgi:hypothetical protein